MRAESPKYQSATVPDQSVQVVTADDDVIAQNGGDLRAAFRRIEAGIGAGRHINQ